MRVSYEGRGCENEVVFPVARFVPSFRLPERAICFKWHGLESSDRTHETKLVREAKDGFGLMIDTAHAELVVIEKRGHGMVVVVSVEEYAAERRPPIQCERRRTLRRLHVSQASEVRNRH